MDPLPTPAPLPEHEYLQQPVDEPSEPLVEALKVYSRRQKSKTTPSPPCQSVTPDSGNPTSVPSLDSSNPVCCQ